MNPALLRFLAVFKGNLQKRQEELAHLISSEQAGKAYQALGDLIENFITDKNIDDAVARNFIIDFYALNKKFPSALFSQFAENEIYTLNLLLHQSKANREFQLSSFAEHFAPFLQCPFEIKLEHNQLKFIFNAVDLENNEKWDRNCQSFCNALRNLRMEPLDMAPSMDIILSSENKRALIIPKNHINDMLQLAQFELIDEENIPKELKVLEQKFRNTLTELIQTEVSFSAQCGKLAALLAKKLDLPESNYDLKKGETELLKQAQIYYQEIAKNPYPWFGDEIGAAQLKEMSFDKMLELCHNLHEALSNNDHGKADEIGRRLKIIGWASIQYAGLNHLINDKNKLEFPKDAHEESDQQIAKNYLIPPIQRLPRIMMLTGDLIKCVNVVAINKLDQKKAGYLNELQALNAEWARAAKKINDLVPKSAEKNDSGILPSLFKDVQWLKSPHQFADLSVSTLTLSVNKPFSRLRYSTQPRSNVSETLSEEDFIPIEDDMGEISIPKNFQDDLTLSVFFAEETASVAETTTEPEFSVPSPEEVLLSENDNSEDKLVSPAAQTTIQNNKNATPLLPEKDIVITEDSEKNPPHKESKKSSAAKVDNKSEPQRHAPGKGSTQTVLQKLTPRPLKQTETTSTKKENIALATQSPTLSQIGGGVAVFGGIVLIAAGVVLTLLQPHLFVLGIVLIWEGCLLTGIGATLLKAKPAPIDFDKDPNSPYFLGIDVGKKDNPVDKPYPSPLPKTEQNIRKELNLSDSENEDSLLYDQRKSKQTIQREKQDGRTNRRL